MYLFVLNIYYVLNVNIPLSVTYVRGDGGVFTSESSSGGLGQRHLRKPNAQVVVIVIVSYLVYGLMAIVDVWLPS